MRVFDRRGDRLFRSVLVLLGCVLAQRLTPAQQDTLHLKFESGSGTTVVNYARHDPSVPDHQVPTLGVLYGIGFLPAVDATTWGTGKFGQGGLKAATGSNLGSLVDFGWDHSVEGDLTIAFFARLARPLDPSSGVVIAGTSDASSGQSALRVFCTPTTHNLGLVFGTHVLFTSLNLGTSTPLAVWAHLAIVVDRNANVFRVYLNGSLTETTILPNNFYDVLGDLSGFLIGDFSSHYDLDEFRIAERVVQQSELQAWANQDLAAAAVFGEPCGPFGIPALVVARPSIVGAPFLGNQEFGIEVFGLPGMQVQLVSGFSRTNEDGVPLPFDLGAFDSNFAGCLWRTSVDFVQPGVVPPTGRRFFPLALPFIPALEGLCFYSQAVLFSPLLQTTSITNALAASLGTGSFAPAISSVLPSQGSTLGGTTVTIFGQHFSPGAAVRFDGAFASGTIVSGDTAITCVTPPGSPGFADVEVLNLDGKSDTALGAFEYQTPLSISDIQPRNAPPGTTLTITGVAISGSAVVTIDGQSVLPTTISASQITLPAPSVNSCNVPVIVTNPSGQTAQTTWNRLPSVANVIPSTGPAAGGTTVIIVGSNFGPGTTVTFNGTPTTSTNVGPTGATIQVMTPPGTSGPAVITIQGAQGCSTTAAFTYL